ALMGSNYLDYLDEAYRILKPLGMLYIAEPKKKGERIQEELLTHLKKIGFTVFRNEFISNHLYIDCLKE
ncbi:hypothetical protein HOD02_05310, partial [bacterium]|nr:hypothetical protein [bacterium]